MKVVNDESDNLEEILCRSRCYVLSFLRPSHFGALVQQFSAKNCLELSISGVLRGTLNGEDYDDVMTFVMCEINALCNLTWHLASTNEMQTLKLILASAFAHTRNVLFRMLCPQ
ncbi:hypothetical protein CEXT_576111 [Caerostris extrusa]|uniref:Uncharacterized protein n=1 Tax=Caerostris extrusa TaxID=172846 RepID=A0AAV4NCR2_CAEEX|nr:hypothetical protein CEXT_576111 [Caerostris extrusa]